MQECVSRKGGGGVDLVQPELTRWPVRLADRDQERRFRRYHAQSGARTALWFLVTVLAANVVIAGTRALISELPPQLAVAHTVATAAGAAIIVWLWRERRYGYLMAALVAGATLLTALMAVVVVSADAHPVQGVIVVLGGIVAIYILVPLDLMPLIALALGYSAVTLTLWLMTAQVPDVERGYTAAAMVIAHIGCVIQARRAHQERRTLFAQREALLALSSVDALTGLPNRRSMDIELERCWQRWRATTVPLSMLMIDIDHFKSFNDTFGHVAGDQVLRRVADVIRNATPQGQGRSAARYGGEEFCCLLSGVDLGSATAVAQEIRRAVSDLDLAAAPGHGLTVSIGVAEVDPSMTTFEQLVGHADWQLYRAKREGRNRVCAGHGGAAAVA